jgi:hypothetical protein
MIFHINDTVHIRDLQSVFSQAYPYLKIDFFDKPHGWLEGNSNAHQYHPDFRLSLIESKHVQHVSIEVHPWTKVGTLEQTFRELLGVYVQVSRRNGETWIQTAGTDELNLDEQNEIGRRSTEQIHENLWIEREAPL